MKTKMMTVLFLLLVIMNGCRKDRLTPEPYSDYMSLTLNSGTNLGFKSDSIIQIYLRNDSDKEFQKECLISYILKNEQTSLIYKAQTYLVNTYIPDFPTGQLKLLKRDAQFFTFNLSEIAWNDYSVLKLPSGQYSIYTQLFIKDPYSPMNIITSNNIIIEIK